jgi:hypothetical protein
LQFVGLKDPPAHLRPYAPLGSLDKRPVDRRPHAELENALGGARVGEGALDRALFND